MVNKDLFRQLDEYSKEKGISIEELYETIRKAIEVSAKKVAPTWTIKVTINPEKNEILTHAQKVVVEEIEAEREDGMAQITLEEARQIKPNAKVGDIISKVLNTKEDFGRQNAKSAKSTLTSGIRSIERKKLLEYFNQFVDEMLTATVISGTKEDKFLTLDVGEGLTTIIPQNELLAGDDFKAGDRIKVYVKAVEETTKDPKVKVSRTDKNLVTRLIENYVPEVKEGIVEIKGIARDAGSRTKIAVFSNDSKVDALGSCVGENGARIGEIVRELSGEKIDLYKWSEDPEELVTQALQPAKVTFVKNIDVKEKSALAIVPDDQLSLAIGKSGQNVRLAVQSSGWKIDIRSSKQAYDEGLLKDYIG